MTMEERKDAYEAMTTEKVGAGVLTVGAIALVAIVYVLAGADTRHFGKMPEWTLQLGRQKAVHRHRRSGSIRPRCVGAVLQEPLLPRHRAGHRPARALIGFTLGTILGGGDADRGRLVRRLGAALLALVYGRLSLEGVKLVAMGAMLAGALVGLVFGNLLVPGITGVAFSMLCLALIPGFLMSPQMRAAAYGTMVTSAMVLFLAVASNVFGAVFTKLGTADLITNALIAVPLSDWWKLALIMAIIFILGWPFEWPAIILVFLPIVLPVIEKLKLRTGGRASPSASSTC